ncbi:unnamed protein product [Menidia menidia]|uniref:General transcription factor IIF subunit 2 n=1 Tax=Menidia menidia TaxID=238744 RepID=A0A8S4A758_9TELE|nr:unnamed protein product [Menidia menidia]
MSEKGEVDLTGAKQNTGVWLVKVSFTLNEELTVIEGIEDKTVSAPREHPFTMQTVGGQMLAVFTESSSGEFPRCSPRLLLQLTARFLSCEMLSIALVRSQKKDLMAAAQVQGRGQVQVSPPFCHKVTGLSVSFFSTDGLLDKLALEGMVVQRAECRPAVSESYMKLKRLQIEESSKPVRLSQQLSKPVTSNYKPVAIHDYNREYEKRKKEEGKRARATKQQVLDMLFSAFEKHQYYNIKDLVDITKQPVIYLKEILRDIGIYNVKGTHKNTWELKPEYRHYQNEEKTDE